VLTFLALVAGPVQRAHADKLYFAGALWPIGRANLDGTELQLSDFSPYYASGLALDPAGGRAYWVEAYSVYSMKLDLTGTKQVVFTFRTNPSTGLAFDAATSRFYWGDDFGIWSRSLSSPFLQRVVRGHPVYGGDVELDSVHGKLYWVETSGYVNRVNLDGTGLETLPLTGLLGNYAGLYLDTMQGKLYWADPAGTIFRANLDGSNQEPLFQIDGGIISDVAVDSAHGKIYWTDAHTSRVMRANLDGSDREDLFASYATRLAILVPEPSSFVLAALGLIGLAASGWRKRRSGSNSA
jgi:hypothetical protein